MFKEEISKTTLKNIDEIEKSCSLKVNILKEETELLDLIRQHTSCKSSKDVIELIEKDGQELVNALIKIYKRNKLEYL